MADMLYANLLHLSYNFWNDWDDPQPRSPYVNARPFLRFHDKLWGELLAAMVKAKMNAVVIDLGDGVRYASHPEIAVEHAWPTERLRTEVKRLREMGLEPLPKLNFSTCHDVWLGRYARMVSTDEYYGVCRDLIAEVIDLFDKPRLFHLGMDEENANLQKKYEHAVIRQHGLWWRDARFFIKQVETGGSRAWVWSDYMWDKQEEFYANMSKSVMQSNWHYRMDFEVDRPRVKDYIGLDEHGYDQIPTVSNWYTSDNIAAGMAFCRKHISRERLKGFLLAPWRPTLFETRDRHFDALDHFARAIEADRAKHP